jgi:hypothetical protein
MREQLKKFWKDPVGSNIFAFLLISLLTYLTGAIYSLIKGIYNKIPFGKIVHEIFGTLATRTKIPIWIVLFFLAICLTIIFQIIKKSIELLRSNEGTKQPVEKKIEPPIFYYGSGQHFFSSRIGSAFPGMRNKLEWYHGRQALDRLERLLAEPLIFKSEKGGLVDPLWWFRAGSSMYIEKFKRLSNNKCLMNIDELVIDKIAVYQNQQEYPNFIYVEVLGEKPCGVYKYPKGYIDERMNKFGYYWEEYGLINGLKITREEYDDGAATIKGKVIDTYGAELRSRYLTRYNFIITTNDSPYNSRKFDRGSGEILNGILKGEKEFKELFDFLMTFDQYEKFNA